MWCFDVVKMVHNRVRQGNFTPTFPRLPWAVSKGNRTWTSRFIRLFMFTSLTNIVMVDQLNTNNILVDWMWFSHKRVNLPITGCRKVCNTNMSVPSLHHLSMTSSLLRTDLPPITRLNLLAAASLSQFDSTLSISLVPFHRLTDRPADLTPDEIQTVIR